MQNESLVIKFAGYDVTKLVVIKSNDFVATEEEGNVSFLYKIAVNDEICKANVIIGVKIDAVDDFPYNIELILKGNFVLLECKEDDLDNYLMMNASAIMYPYLRATLSTITSQLESEKIILPTLNFISVFENTDREALFLNSNAFEDFETFE